MFWQKSAPSTTIIALGTDFLAREQAYLRNTPMALVSELWDTSFFRRSMCTALAIAETFDVAFKAA